MNNFTENELKTEQQITEVERIIAIRASEFIGEIGDFQWFLRQGIAKELHSMTTSEHQGQKPSLRDIEDVMFNITILNDLFKLLSKREHLELVLSEETAALN